MEILVVPSQSNIWKEMCMLRSDGLEIKIKRILLLIDSVAVLGAPAFEIGYAPA